MNKLSKILLITLSFIVFTALGAGGAYWGITYFSNAQKERQMLSYMNQYNALGVNLATVGQFCTKEILANIPKAELLLQSMTELSAELPNNNGYQQFIAMQIGARGVNLNSSSPIQQCQSFLAKTNSHQVKKKPTQPVKIIKAVPPRKVVVVTHPPQEVIVYRHRPWLRRVYVVPND